MQARKTISGLVAATILLVALASASPAVASPHAAGRIAGLIEHRGVIGRAAPVLPSARVHIPQPALAAGDLTYHGGPVMHQNTTHVVFWDPAGALTQTYHTVVDGFFRNVAADSGRNSNVYSSDPQYTDGSGPAAYASTYAGEVIDTTPYPANGCTDPTRAVCLTDAQLETELDALITQRHLPRGLGDIYFILTPSNVGTCIDAAGQTCLYNYYCAYHSSFVSGSQQVLYADLPYPPDSGCDAGQHPNGDIADATVDTASHEHSETITDPLGDAWYDVNDNEDGDKCDFVFGSASGPDGAQYNETIGTGRYYIQEEWSNRGSACVQRMDLPPTATLTVGGAQPANGQPVAFDGSASSDPDGSVTSYAWSFSDGSSDAGPSVTHVFATPGTYQASLTVTDNDGSTASATTSVTIVQANRAPSCAPTSAATLAGVAVTVALSCSDPDPGDSATISLVAPPAHGSLGAIDPASGHIDYTPAPGYSGEDSFQVRATDSRGATSAPVAVTVTVEPAAPADATSAGAHAVRMAHAVHVSRARARSTQITYWLGHDAVATFQLERRAAGVRRAGRGCVRAPGARRGRRCTLYVAAGPPLRLTGTSGANTVALAALAGRARLAPGRYRLVASVDGGAASVLTLRVGR